MNLLVFRDQAIDIHEQLDLARHFWNHYTSMPPLQSPKKPGLEEVHGRYLISISLIALDLSGGKSFTMMPLVVPDPSTFSKFELWHTDVGKLFSGIPKLSQSNLPTGLLEVQPPSTTSLKVLTCPEYGGDTIWSSG